MQQAQKIAQSTLWQIIGKIIGTFFGVITIALITRYLGQEQFGYYTTAVAFMQFFGTLVDMGLYLVCLREISAKPDQEASILSNILALRIVSALLFIGGGVILILAFPYPDVVKISAAIVSISFFFMSLVQILTTGFQKYLKMGLVALAEITGRAGLLGLTIYFIYKGVGLPTLMWANVLNTFIYALILWFLIRPKIKITLKFNLSYWLSVIKSAWPIGLGVAFNLVYFRADTIILSVYKTAEEVGIYGAPYKILEIIATFPHMFMGLVMPMLTVTWLKKNLTELQLTFQKIFNFFIIISIPMVIGTYPLANRIMSLIAGPEFMASGPVLIILMLATAIIFIGILMTYAVVVIEKQKTMLKYFLVAAISALAGYFIFIPRFSYFGAAWVTVIIEAFIAVSGWFIFKKQTQIKLSLIPVWQSLFASIIMFSFILTFQAYSLGLLIPISIIIYFAIMALIKAIDIKFIFSILKR